MKGIRLVWGGWVFLFALGSGKVWGQWNPSPACWTLGTSGNEEARRLLEAGNALYVTGISSYTAIGGQDVFLLKISSSGVPVWAISLGTQQNEKVPYGLVALGDTVLCILMETDTLVDDVSPMVICVDTLGTLRSAFLVYEPLNMDEIEPRDLLVLPDGNLLIIAQTDGYTPTGSDGIVVVKVSPYTGTIQAQAVIYMGAPLQEDLEPFRATVDPLGRVVITGRAESSLGGDDAVFLLVIQIQGGNIGVVDARLYQADKDAWGVDVVPVKGSLTQNPGYVVVAYTDNNITNRDVLVFRVDTSSLNTLQWVQVYSSFNQKNENPYAVDYLPGLDRLIVTARQNDNTSSAHRILLLALDARTGDTLWTRGLDGIAEDIPRDVIWTSTGLVAVGGYTTSWGAGGKSIYVAVLSSDGVILPGIACCALDTPGGLLQSFLTSASVNIQVTSISLASLSAGRVAPNPNDTTISCGSPVPPSWNVPTGCWHLGTDSLDKSYTASVSASGDLLVAGVTRFSSSPTGRDFSIMRISPAGAILWTRIIGRTGEDVPRALAECPGGNIVVVGTSDSFSTEADIYVVMVDASGNVLWTRVIGGLLADVPASVHCTSSEIVIAGSTKSWGQGGWDAFVLRMDHSGNVLQMTTLGTSTDEWITDAFLDGTDLFLAGASGSIQSDFLLLRTSVSTPSTPSWVSVWGSSTKNEKIHSVEITFAGDLLVSGIVEPGPAGSADMYLATVDPATGTLYDEVIVGGVGTDIPARAQHRWWDASYAVAGITTSWGPGTPVFYFLALNSALTDTLFTAVFGTQLTDSVSWTIQTTDGGIVAGGWTDSTSVAGDSTDILIIKLNAYGQMTTSPVCCSPFPPGVQLTSPGYAVQSLSLTAQNVTPFVSQGGWITQGGVWICGNPLSLVVGRLTAFPVPEGDVYVTWEFTLPELVAHYRLYRVSLSTLDTLFLWEGSAEPSTARYQYVDQGILPGTYVYLLDVRLISGEHLWEVSDVVHLMTSVHQALQFRQEGNLLILTTSDQTILHSLRLALYTLDGRQLTEEKREVLLPGEQVRLLLPPGEVPILIHASWMGGHTSLILPLPSSVRHSP